MRYCLAGERLLEELVQDADDPTELPAKCERLHTAEYLTFATASALITSAFPFNNSFCP